MKKIILVAISAVAIFGTLNLLLAYNTDDEKLISELLPGITGITKSNFSVPSDIKSKIESALGERIDDNEKVEIYSGETKEGENAKATLLTVKASDGKMRLGVALVGTRIVALKLFDNPQFDDFLKQFIDTKYSLENLEKDLNLLKTALKKAESGKGKKAKEMESLLKVAHTMDNVGDSYGDFSKCVKSKDASSKKYADYISNAYKDIISAADNIKFLKNDDIATFRNIAVDAQQFFDKAGLSIENGDFDKIKNELKTISKNYCGKCHSSFLKQFSEKRISYNIGDGYFYVGHDVKADKDEALSQTIATAIKKATIFILESK